jgi:hypothetical protein
MRIARKFKQLTKLTYPHGTEDGLLKQLPQGYKKDKHGNYYLVIGNIPSTMFTCHLDTACSKQVSVNHVTDGVFIKTDGKSILGADDKAGMTVMLYMIENNIPGLYYFFIGEEVGCVGSGRLAKNWTNSEFSNSIKKVISFDRRGTKSIITHQLYGRCCSDEFASDLANRLNMTNYGFSFKLDDTGIYTDSAKFIDLVPECTNISVGYYNEHTTSERQDIDFLQRLCKGVCEVDWENIVVLRDPALSNFEYFNDDDDDFDEWLVDEDNVIWSDSYYSFFKKDNDVIKMYISKDQIDDESMLISNWLMISGCYPGHTDIIWNGNSLYVKTENIDYVGDRIEIIEFIPELKTVSNRRLKEKL